MNFIVDRIPGSLRIDPDAAGQDSQRRQREKQPRRRDGADSVSISEEARRRYSEGYRDEPEELEGA